MVCMRINIGVFTKCRFSSIGLFEYDNRNFRTLLVTLVPPAVFIAVMALQLRFFKPRPLTSTAGAQVTSQPTISLYAFLPKNVREKLRELNEAEVGEDSDEEVDGLCFVHVHIA